MSSRQTPGSARRSPRQSPRPTSTEWDPEYRGRAAPSPRPPSRGSTGKVTWATVLHPESPSTEQAQPPSPGFSNNSVGTSSPGLGILPTSSSEPLLDTQDTRGQQAALTAAGPRPVELPSASSIRNELTSGSSAAKTSACPPTVSPVATRDAGTSVAEDVPPRAAASPSEDTGKKKKRKSSPSTSTASKRSSGAGRAKAPALEPVIGPALETAFVFAVSSSSADGSPTSASQVHFKTACTSDPLVTASAIQVNKDWGEDPSTYIGIPPAAFGLFLSDGSNDMPPLVRQQSLAFFGITSLQLDAAQEWLRICAELGSVAPTPPTTPIPSGHAPPLSELEARWQLCAAARRQAFSPANPLHAWQDHHHLPQGIRIQYALQPYDRARLRYDQVERKWKVQQDLFFRITADADAPAGVVLVPLENVHRLWDRVVLNPEQWVRIPPETVELFHPLPPPGKKASHRGVSRTAALRERQLRNTWPICIAACSYYWKAVCETVSREEFWPIKPAPPSMPPKFSPSAARLPHRAPLARTDSLYPTSTRAADPRLRDGSSHPPAPREESNEGSHQVAIRLKLDDTVGTTVVALSYTDSTSTEKLLTSLIRSLHLALPDWGHPSPESHRFLLQDSREEHEALLHAPGVPPCAASDLCLIPGRLYDVNIERCPLHAGPSPGRSGYSARSTTSPILREAGPPLFGDADTRTAFASRATEEDVKSSRPHVGEMETLEDPAKGSQIKIPAQTPSRAVQQQIWCAEKLALADVPPPAIPKPETDPEGFLRYMQENLHKPVEYRYTTRYVDHIIIPDCELSIDIPRARGMQNYTFPVSAQMMNITEGQHLLSLQRSDEEKVIVLAGATAKLSANTKLPPPPRNAKQFRECLLRRGEYMSATNRFRTSEEKDTYNNYVHRRLAKWLDLYPLEKVMLADNDWTHLVWLRFDGDWFRRHCKEAEKIIEKYLVGPALEKRIGTAPKPPGGGGGNGKGGGGSRGKGGKGSGNNNNSNSHSANSHSSSSNKRAPSNRQNNSRGHGGSGSNGKSAQQPPPKSRAAQNPLQARNANTEWDRPAYAACAVGRIKGQIVCRNYNWGICDSDECTTLLQGKPSGFLHRCSHCGKQHRLIECTKYAADFPDDLARGMRPPIQVA